VSESIPSSAPAVPRHFCTYFDHNYLPQGIALYHSLRRHCPAARLIVLCLSEQAWQELTVRRLPGLLPLKLAELEAFDPELAACRANRTLIEFIFTCSAPFCRWVFARFPEIELLTYLDADMYFFSSVEPMFAELGAASIGIIPHRLQATSFARRFGQFNVGWISFRRDEEGLACIERWRRQCLEWCYDRVEPTRYADQKYLDEWPQRYRNVCVFRHPGANLARWNVGERRVTAHGEQVRVNGQPLIFFHFASFKQVTEHLYESAFATHWTRPSRIVREYIFGPYVAELRHAAGPLLPRGPRRLWGSRLRGPTPARIARQFLVLARSICFWDFVLYFQPESLDARFSHVVGDRPALGPAPAGGRRRVWFAFADAKIHSGQREASRLTYSALDPRRWDVRLIVLPGFEHDRAGMGRWVRYVLRLGAAWVEFLPMFFAERPVLHLNIGQTKLSLFRDGVPLRGLQLWKRDAHIVLMTQGSIFMRWHPDDVIARVFGRLAADAAITTVLGPHQAAQMVRLGVPAQRVVIRNNTCGADGIDESEVEEKQLRPGPVRVLMLSTLIDTKGYPEFLEALVELSARPGPPIEAVLCGRVLVTEHSQRFRSIKSATLWIRDQLAAINTGGRVSIRWLDEGADADAKWLLYRQAQIFVLPSYYPVEAQPIVNVEAMAFGCAIVTTKAGEIEWMFGEGTGAMLLETVSAPVVADAIERLVRAPERRRELGVAARRRFCDRFSPDSYAREWEALLAGTDRGSHD
jgi:glycosyltransferase involved in cell wall biosynthesis